MHFEPFNFNETPPIRRLLLQHSGSIIYPKHRLLKNNDGELEKCWCIDLLQKELGNVASSRKCPYQLINTAPYCYSHRQYQRPSYCHLKLLPVPLHLHANTFPVTIPTFAFNTRWPRKCSAREWWRMVISGKKSTRTPKRKSCKK